MIEVEPSRYRRVTGGIACVENLFDLQVVEDTKQSDDPESIRVLKRELNPAATEGTSSGGMVKHSPGRATEVFGRSDET
jgi:hypothetical protein